MKKSAVDADTLLTLEMLENISNLQIPFPLLLVSKGFNNGFVQKPIINDVFNSAIVEVT